MVHDLQGDVKLVVDKVSTIKHVLLDGKRMPVEVGQTIQMTSLGHAVEFAAIYADMAFTVMVGSGEAAYEITPEQGRTYLLVLQHRHLKDKLAKQKAKYDELIAQTRHKIMTRVVEHGEVKEHDTRVAYIRKGSVTVAWDRKELDLLRTDVSMAASNLLALAADARQRNGSNRYGVDRGEVNRRLEEAAEDLHKLAKRLNEARSTSTGPERLVVT